MPLTRSTHGPCTNGYLLKKLSRVLGRCNRPPRITLQPADARFPAGTPAHPLPHLHSEPHWLLATALSFRWFKEPRTMPI